LEVERGASLSFFLVDGRPREAAADCGPAVQEDLAPGSRARGEACLYRLTASQPGTVLRYAGM